VGEYPFNFTVEKPIRAAQAAPSLVKVVPFNRRGRLLARFEPATSTRSPKTVILPPSVATEGSTSGWYGPKGIIIYFAHTDRGRQAAKGHKCQSNADETGLTITDYVAIAYVVMSVAFFPALAWLLSS
jgi:hypothetical protein